MPVTMTRVGHALLTLVGAACFSVGCSGSNARDKNFNTDAASGFEPPVATSDAGDALSDTAGQTGTAGTTGAAGGTAGAAGGAAGSTDDAAVLSDGGAG